MSNEVGYENYINNKYNDILERYEEYEKQKYLLLYQDIPYEKLKVLFSIFHNILNALLEYLNERSSSSHFTANESRELIFLLAEINKLRKNLLDSSYRFHLDSYYEKRLLQVQSFLSNSGGSPIPDNFIPIEIIEIAPIFFLEDTTEVQQYERKEKVPIKLIGEGSYAKVFKYKNTQYDRSIIIKRAKKNLTPDELERFKIEFDTMKLLSSPYIVEVYKYNQEHTEYTMEYIDDTLKNFITTNNTKIDINLRFSLIKQLFQAFKYIHSKEKFHRDISLTNILIKNYDQLSIIKISDFGYVKIKESDLTREDTKFVGSLNDPNLRVYGYANYNILHETYALSRVIYFIMTGKTIIENFDNLTFKNFIENGISDDNKKRYNSMDHMEIEFQKVIISIRSKS